MSIQESFEKFMQEDFEDAVVSSTKASWGGSGYSVELFSSGEYRALWDEHIGNRYDSPGLLLAIPPLTDAEWDDDPALSYFERVERAMRESFEEAIKQLA